MWKIAVAGAFVACSLGAAQAGEPAFEAMDGVSAVPMTDRDMQAVQGKVSFATITSALELLGIVGLDVSDARVIPGTDGQGAVVCGSSGCNGDTVNGVFFGDLAPLSQ